MKDTHTYGKEMARNGRTKVIYIGTFISIQTLGVIVVKFATLDHIEVSRNWNLKTKRYRVFDSKF